MKNKCIMGLLDDYAHIGSPRPTHPHQYLMKLILNRLDSLGERYYTLTEATLTADLDDLAPDVITFCADGESFVPVFFVEITRKRKLKSIIKKCEEVKTRFPGVEIFILEYDEMRWYSMQESVYSHILQADIATFFQFAEHEISILQQFKKWRQ